MAVISIKNKIKSGSLLAGNEFFELGDYEPIATVNGTGSASTITFSNIPQTYQHLQLRATSRTAYSAVSDTMYAYNFNGSTASTNSATHILYGSGTSVALATSATGNYSSIIGYTTGGNALSNAYGAAVIDFLDYSNTNKNKTIRGFFGWDDNTTSQATFVGITSSFPVALGTGAITEMTIVFNGNVTTASRFALYGIKG
jgi:hypothetical protein